MIFPCGFYGVLTFFVWFYDGVMIFSGWFYDGDIFEIRKINTPYPVYPVEFWPFSKTCKKKFILWDLGHFYILREQL